MPGASPQLFVWPCPRHGRMDRPATATLIDKILGHKKGPTQVRCGNHRGSRPANARCSDSSGRGPNDAGTEREPVILHGTLKSRIARLLTTLGMRDRPQHVTIAHEAGASPTGPDPTAQSPARLESHPRTATTTDTPAQSKGPASTTAPMNTNQKQQPRALKNRTSFTSLPTSHTQYHGS